MNCKRCHKWLPTSLTARIVTHLNDTGVSGVLKYSEISTSPGVDHLCSRDLRTRFTGGSKSFKIQENIWRTAGKKLMMSVNGKVYQQLPSIAPTLVIACEMQA
jgi:hypothetical protein